MAHYMVKLKKIVLFSIPFTVCRIRKFCRYKSKIFSSGMISRLAFSIAVNIDADILFRRI
jgi:ABC-type polysaccharide/polyol phosphate transport system ATPase subunit